MTDSSSSHQVTADTSRPSATSYFFGVGWGSPQGVRFEYGQIISSTIIVGATFTINDQWSNDHPGGRVGIIVGARALPSKPTLMPYALFSAGETFSFFNKTDYYLFVHFGVKYIANSILRVRPEIGVDATSKNSDPGRPNNRTWLGFNIAMELEIH